MSHTTHIKPISKFLLNVSQHWNVNCCGSFCYSVGSQYSICECYAYKTLPFTWKVDSSLNSNRSSNLSSSISCCFAMQKSRRAGLSVSFNCWINCSLKDVMCSRLIKTRQTFFEWHWSSLRGLMIDFQGLHLNTFRTCSITLYEVEGRTVCLAGHKHPSIINLQCQITVDFLSGGSFLFLAKCM